MGQSAEVRGQPGRHAGVRGVEVVQERAGGLGAHVTQQHALAPRTAVLHNEEPFAVHLRTKSSTEGLRPPRQDVGPHRGPGWLRASPRLHAARPQHRHQPASRQSAGQELRSGPNTPRLAKSDCDGGSSAQLAPSRQTHQRHEASLGETGSHLPDSCGMHSSLMRVGTGQHRNVCQQVDQDFLIMETEENRTGLGKMDFFSTDEAR